MNIEKHLASFFTDHWFCTQPALGLFQSKVLADHKAGTLFEEKNLKNAIQPRHINDKTISIDPYWEGYGVEAIQEAGTTVIIDVFGVLTKYDGWARAGSSSIIKTLRACEANEAITAVVLNIDGPGGASMAIRELAQFVRNMKTPTLSYISDMACSAHAQLAAVCEVSYANHAMALTGSIGTYRTVVDLTKYFKKIGIEIDGIYAPQSDKKNYERRAWQKGNKAPIVEDLSIWADDFINSMKEARPQVKDEKDVWRGATLYAKDALEIGLIDGIGSLDVALQALRTSNNDNNLNFNTSNMKIKSILSALIGKSEKLTADEIAEHNKTLADAKVGAFLVPATEEIADINAFTEALTAADAVEESLKAEQSEHAATKTKLADTEKERDAKATLITSLTSLFGDAAKEEGFVLEDAVKTAILDQKKLKDGPAGGNPAGTPAGEDGNSDGMETDEINVDELPHNKLADSFFN